MHERVDAVNKWRALLHGQRRDVMTVTTRSGATHRGRVKIINSDILAVDKILGGELSRVLIDADAIESIEWVAE